jgi:hypothetical protein
VDAAALVAGFALLVATALLVTAALRLRSPLAYVLGVFAVGWATVVLLTSALSVVDHWTRAAMLAALLAAAGAALGAWLAVGRPRPPSFRPAWLAARDVLGDRLLAALAAAAALAFLYLAALGLSTPPGNWDELIYHLPRMVLWIQQDAVAAIPGSPSSNLDANPVAAELPQALTLLLYRSDRFVAWFQLLCLPLASLAIAGTARRIGLDRRAAAYGALLFVFFPAIAFQAPTAYVDLALVTAFMAAAYFALGTGNGELALFGLALALATGTKVAGLLFLPAFLLFVLVAIPRARRLRVLGVGAVAVTVGCWWYAYNLVRTGAWEGGMAVDYGQVPSRAPIDVVARFERYATELFNLSGVPGNDRYVFAIAAVAIAIVGVAIGRARAGLVVAGCVAVAPWLVIACHEILVRVFGRLWILVGHRDVSSILPADPSTTVSTPEVWLGPAYGLALIAACYAVARHAAPGRMRRALVVALVLSPAAIALVNAAAFTVDQQRGRFFLLSAAFTALAMGLVVRLRVVAAALGAIAVVALFVGLVHLKGRTMGLELLAPVDDLAAWSAPRWEVQSAFSRDHPEVGRALEAVATEIPPTATIAIARSVQMPLYQVMGGGPWRRTVFLRPDGTVPAEADWVAVPLFVHPRLDPATWRLLPGTGTGEAWTIYRRVG